MSEKEFLQEGIRLCESLRLAIEEDTPLPKEHFDGRFASEVEKMRFQEIKSLLEIRETLHELL